MTFNNNVILEKQSSDLLAEVKSIGESCLINIIIIPFGKQLPFFLSKQETKNGERSFRS